MLKLDAHQLAAANVRRSEWLLTDGSGGFAMGTVEGVNTRRYHGLLCASLKPPVRRVMVVSAVADEVVWDDGDETRSPPTENRVALTRFDFGAGPPDEPHPQLVLFEQDRLGGVCRWHYDCTGGKGQFDGPWVDKGLMLSAASEARLWYKYRGGAPGSYVNVLVRPLLAMRDFHSLGRAGQQAPAIEWAKSVITVRSGELICEIACPGATFTKEGTWWRSLNYARERERGQDSIDTLFCPGLIEFHIRNEFPPELREIVFSIPEATAERPQRTKRAASESLSFQDRRRRVAQTLRTSLGPAITEHQADLLAAASDDFVCCSAPRGRLIHPSTTVIAGYPWFADWGRDTLISLPGLLLATGRHDEAQQVLETFTANIRGGLVPNRFDDDTGEPHYNTSDASLWFLHAAASFAAATERSRFFDEALVPACLEILDAYEQGTSFGIGVDPADGLVHAGDANTQLTWMDAQHNGIVFTPRFGKPIELSALWYSGLRRMAPLLRARHPREAARTESLASRANESFARAFFDPPRGWCADRLEPISSGAWRPVFELRPNQVFAACFEHSPLTLGHRTSVVRTLINRLHTPRGVRTLAPAEPGYKAHYQGALPELDAAYHMGTAWPWLIGPLAEAALRVLPKDEGKATALRLIQPLLELLESPGVYGVAAGRLPEVVDAEPGPDGQHVAGGCPAQAWSVAELIRVLALCAR
ncbi:MAG: glycogen debranching enzyme family protein [Phycisphaerales bacterium]|nr:glycogen debranching enzyme family protein [Phycisphaerales bacterium]